VIHKSVSLAYEPASEPLHISAQEWFLNQTSVRDPLSSVPSFPRPVFYSFRKIGYKNKSRLCNESRIKEGARNLHARLDSEARERERDSVRVCERARERDRERDR